MFDAPASSSVSAQRSFGSLDLSFARADNGLTAPVVLRQEGALKVRLPSVHEGQAQAIVINTAGGLTGGDRLDLGVRLETGAALTVSGQACEKLYKSAGGAAAVAVRLQVAEAAALEWLMQPAILFDRSRFIRTLSADIHSAGRLLAVEGLVFGRTAMAERMESGLVAESWRVRRDGKLIYADGLRLDGAVAAALARPAVLNNACAMASILYVGGDASAYCGRFRAIAEDLSECVGAASAWNGLMTARLVAEDGYRLTRALTEVLSRLRNAPLPRPWMI